MNKKILLMLFVFLAFIPSIYSFNLSNIYVNNTLGNISLYMDDSIEIDAFNVTGDYIIFYNFSYSDGRNFIIEGPATVSELTFLLFDVDHTHLNSSQFINSSGHLAYGNYTDTPVYNPVFPSQYYDTKIQFLDYVDCTENSNCTLYMDNSTFDLSNKSIQSGIITHDSFTNPNNFFDLNSSTYANKQYSTSQIHIGKTFDEIYLETVQVKVDTDKVTGGSASTRTVALEKYDGSSWSLVQNLITTNPNGAGAFDGTVVVQDKVQGLRITALVSTGTHEVRTFSLSLDTNYTFPQWGSRNFTLSETDYLTTSNQTGSFRVNPYQWFRFNDSSRNLYVENYSFGGYNSSGQYINIPVYDLNNGSNTLLFALTGYNQSSHTFTVDQESSLLNTTFQVQPVNFNFNVYSSLNYSALTNYDVEFRIQNSSTVLYEQDNVSTSTLTVLYNETFSGPIEVHVTKDAHILSTYYFNLTQYSTISQDIYLRPDSYQTILPITVTNQLGTRYLEDVTISLYGYNGLNAYFISQYVTGSSGEVYLELEQDTKYFIVITKDGYSYYDTDIFSGQSSYVFRLSEITSTAAEFEGFNWNIAEPYFNSSNNVTTFNCYYFDIDSQVNSVKCSLTRQFDTNFNLELTSTASQIGSLEFNVNTQTSDTYYTMTMDVTRNGATTQFQKKFFVTGTNNQAELPESQTSNAISNDENSAFLLTVGIFTLFTVLGAIVYGFTGATLGFLGAITLLTSMDLLSAFQSAFLGLVGVMLIFLARGGE